MGSMHIYRTMKNHFGIAIGLQTGSPLWEEIPNSCHGQEAGALQLLLWSKSLIISFLWLTPHEGVLKLTPSHTEHTLGSICNWINLSHVLPQRLPSLYMRVYEQPFLKWFEGLHAHHRPLLDLITICYMNTCTYDRSRWHAFTKQL